MRRGILANDVLFNGRVINLVRPDDAPKPVVEKTRVKAEPNRDELFEVLRALRKRIADEQNVPPYVVFTDSTLEDMAKQRPTTPDGLRSVSGVGERKLQLFGKRFLEAIVQHVMGRVSNGEKPRGSTQLITLDLYNKGMDLGEMAAERQLTTGSIVGHLSQLKQAGYEVDLTTLITRADRAAIEAAIDVVGLVEGQVKPIYEHLNGRYDYGRIRLVIALLGA